MKRAVLVAMTVFLFVVLAFAGEFYGSTHSNKYHYPGCRLAGKIRRSDLVIFASPEQALKAGYRPCKVCSPPLKSAARDRNGFFSRFAGEEDQER